MTIVQILDLFVFYGIDTVLLASLTAICVQLLKISLFKRMQNKLYTLMPFVIGTLFYAVYASVIHADWAYVLKEYVSVLEHGVSVGALATLEYVLYEQFVREKPKTDAMESVIQTLIEGYVPTNQVEQTAKSIADAIAKDVTGAGATKTADILKDNVSEQVSEKDIQLLSKLIIETLAHLTAV